MKCFLKRLILFFCPIFIYFIVFVIADPLNYWGIIPNKECTISYDPLPKMKYVKNNEVKNIVLGDSRTSHFDMNDLKDISGREIYNMGFGGASLDAMIDLFWWTVENNDLDSVYLQLSFYTMNEDYNFNMIQTNRDIIEHPVKYFFTKQAHLYVFNSIKDYFNNKETETEKSGNELENKKYYAEEVIYPVVENYKISQDELNRIFMMAEYCEMNDVELYIIIPPMDKTIWNEVIKPLDLNYQINEYKKELSKQVVIYDMEYEDMNEYPDKAFIDGFHMYGMEDGIDWCDVDLYKSYPYLADYLENMYGTKKEHMRIWRQGSFVQY